VGAYGNGTSTTEHDRRVLAAFLPAVAVIVIGAFPPLITLVCLCTRAATKDVPKLNRPSFEEAL
jgi:hypothetical protein